MTTMSVSIMENAGLSATAEKPQTVSQNSEDLSNFAITERIANWNIVEDNVHFRVENEFHTNSAICINIELYCLPIKAKGQIRPPHISANACDADIAFQIFDRVNASP